MSTPLDTEPPAIAELTAAQLLDLAYELEAHGLAGRDAMVRRVVRAARAAGLSRTLIDVLVDPNEPEVARLRAFGRIAASLAAPSSATGGPRYETAA